VQKVRQYKHDWLTAVQNGEDLPKWK
jgi:hypothetical protein